MEPALITFQMIARGRSVDGHLSTVIFIVAGTQRNDREARKVADTNGSIV